MPLKVVHPNHYEIVGTGLVLLSSPPILDKNIDLYTGTLTEEIALTSRAPAIIGRERKMTDPSEIESILSKISTRVSEFVADQKIKCILDIRGKREPGFEIKTAHTTSDKIEILETVKTALAMSFPVTVTALGSAEHPVSSNDNVVPTLVLDLGPDERESQRETLISAAAETVGLINSKLGFSEGDEAARDVLD